MTAKKTAPRKAAPAAKPAVKSSPTRKGQPQGVKATGKALEQPAVATKVRTDWEAVERDYRAGNLTLREMATKHGCTNGRICQVAKEKEWTRGDLQSVIKKATQAALIEEHIGAEVSKAKQGLSNTVIAEVELNTQVIQRHRTRVSKAVDVAMRMLEELDSTTLKADELQELFEKVTEDIKGPALAAAQQRFRDLMRLHSRIGSAQKLMAALKDAQVLEAQAYGNLYEVKKGPDELELLSDDELDARLKEKAAKLGL